MRTLGMGIAGSKIHDHCTTIPNARILTWSVEDVIACNSRYATCSRCRKIELLSHDCVILDNKPLCIICSAEFAHGDVPVARTPEQLAGQLRMKTQTASVATVLESRVEGWVDLILGCAPKPAGSVPADQQKLHDALCVLIRDIAVEATRIAVDINGLPAAE